MPEVTSFGSVTLHCADCLTIMREMPDKAFDLAIVDPPYFDGPNRSGYYGTTCAGRNTGKTKQQIREESRAHAEAALAAAQAEFKASPEAAAERLAFDSRPHDLIGKPAMEWVRPAIQAADEARLRIATKHGIADRRWSLHR